MMKENMDQLEQKLREEFDRIAIEEENALQKNGGFIMPEEKKDELYAAIREKTGKRKKTGKTDRDIQSTVTAADEMTGGDGREILPEDPDEMMDEDRGEQIAADAHASDEKVAKRNLYAELSEEDLKALELGRKLMEQEAHQEFQAKAWKKKKRRRVYIGLAAALVTVLALGVTSMGGAERVIRMMTQMVGEREITQIDSSDDNLVVIKEDEEEAYQKISEVFGVEPVRMMYKTKNMKFKKMEFNEDLQTAELFYEYANESVIYLINASYRKTSLGIDVEDEIIDTAMKDINGCEMEIKEYKIYKAEEKKYSASFKYNGLEYWLVGSLEKEEFYNILNNLYFYRESR